METTNRFAPPGAQVDDVALAASGVQPVRLWPPDGRIGRLRFMAYAVGLYLVFFLITFALGLVAAFTQSTPMLATWVGLAVYFVGSVLLLIQRSHDMNMSGWWSLAAFIPLVGLVWLFKGGSHGVNRWGAPPPPNTTGVVVIACILPAIFIVGILAAIAIPAYHDYTVRAKAAASR